MKQGQDGFGAAARATAYLESTYNRPTLSGGGGSRQDGTPPNHDTRQPVDQATPQTPLFPSVRRGYTNHAVQDCTICLSDTSSHPRDEKGTPTQYGCPCRIAVKGTLRCVARAILNTFTLSWRHRSCLNNVLDHAG